MSCTGAKTCSAHCTSYKISTERKNIGQNMEINSTSKICMKYTQETAACLTLLCKLVPARHSLDFSNL